MNLVEGLGIGSIVVLIAMLYFGFIYERNGWTKCESSNVTLTEQITEQNAGVLLAKKQSDAIQAAINSTETNNATLTKNIEVVKAKILALPTTGTCEQAIAWQAKNTAILAGHWQTIAS